MITNFVLQWFAPMAVTDYYALRALVLVELLVLVGLFLMIGKATRRHVWIAIAITVAGVASLVPGILYYMNNDVQDAVIDIPMLLIFPLEILTIGLIVFQLLRKRSNVPTT